jgi:hypothetical protein
MNVLFDNRFQNPRDSLVFGGSSTLVETFKIAGKDGRSPLCVPPDVVNVLIEKSAEI